MRVKGYTKFKGVEKVGDGNKRAFLWVTTVPLLVFKLHSLVFIDSPWKVFVELIYLITV